MGLGTGGGCLEKGVVHSAQGVERDSSGFLRAGHSRLPAPGDGGHAGPVDLFLYDFLPPEPRQDPTHAVEHAEGLSRRAVQLFGHPEGSHPADQDHRIALLPSDSPSHVRDHHLGQFCR